MLQIETIKEYIKNYSWDKALQYLDQVISSQSQNNHLSQYWLSDYNQQKQLIIKTLKNILDNPVQQVLTNLQGLEQFILKSFGKGLILPELSLNSDLNLIYQLLQSSKNQKYLFMLFQQNLCEIKQIYSTQFIHICNKVYLKFLSIISCFIKLIGQPIFQDVLRQFDCFYFHYDQLMGEENMIQYPDKQIYLFLQAWITHGLLTIENALKNQNQIITGNLKQKPQQRLLLFRLFELLSSRHQSLQHQSKLKNILNVIIDKLDIPFTQLQQLPIFWVRDRFQSIIEIYNSDLLLFFVGNILIKKLPSRPQYSKISQFMFPLIKWTCEHILLKTKPINSLSSQKNKLFYVDLFERFSILMGLLNKQKQNESLISETINSIFSKKGLYCSPVLSETLWKNLIQRHDDKNFKTFCMVQYKKILSLSLNQLQSSCITILNSAKDLIFKLIGQLQGNSNPQLIGFDITMTIYFLTGLKKFNNFFLKQTKNKCRTIFYYYFTHEKITNIKLNIKQKMDKIKQSLKDRLEVMKMKMKQNEQLQQVNEVLICIYRIQQEIMYD